MLGRATSTPKLESGTGASKSTYPERKEQSMDWLHPHSSDKVLATSSKLELRLGFGISVNKFWTTWTTHWISLMIKTKNPTDARTSHLDPKIKSGTGVRNRYPPERTGRNNRWIDSILNHMIKTVKSHKNLTTSRLILNSCIPILDN